MTFDELARGVERAVGSAAAFYGSCGVIAMWVASGPLFGWSDTWQLAVNTGTTIVTFLMVFLIQATQTRDTRALHLKLDELIRATQDARNETVLAEEMGREELEERLKELRRLGEARDG